MKDNVVILGFTFPEDMIDKILKHEPSMPIQTLKFSENLRRSLESVGFNLLLASTHPVTSYPRNPKLFFNFISFEEFSTKGFAMPFINILAFKHITRFLSGYLLLEKSIHNFKYETLIIHGIHSPFLFIGYLLKKRYPIKIICVVTDPPSDVKRFGIFERLLRKLDRSIIFSLLKEMDAIITLSEMFIKDHSLDVPYLVIDGFANLPSIYGDNIEAKIYDNKRYRFAYAGGLNEEYGVKSLVEAAIDVPEIDLYIYGKGPLHEYLFEMSNTYENIKYIGFVHPNQLEEKLLLADCLVNPRPSRHSFVRYSFPSKILEYMSLGVPLLTTNLPSLSNDYFPYIYIIDDESVAGITNKLRFIASQDRKVLRQKGMKGKDFIVDTRSTIAQGLKLKKLIDSI